MRNLVLLALFVATVAWGDTLLKQGGVTIGPVTSINCGTNMTCSRSGSVGTLSSSGGGGSGGSGAPVDAGYVVLSGHSSGSTNERTLSAGNYTSIDTGTAGQVQVDWAHGLTCSSGQALVSSGTSAMQCTSTLTASDVACAGTCVADAEISAVSASKLSGYVNLESQVTGILPVPFGGTGLDSTADNHLIVGIGTDTNTVSLLPSCSNATTSKLLYNNSTHVFSCGTDQTGGAGSSNFVEVEVDFGASGNDTASTTVTGQSWVTGTSKVLCTPTMLSTTDRDEGAEDVLIEDIDVAIHTRVVSTGFTVTAHAGQGITFGKFKFHCTGG